MQTQSMRETVMSVFQKVAAEQGRTLAPLSDGLRLVNCGLDSLSFAIVVASLDETLGVDPFSADEHVEFPVTFGEFVELYARSAG